jgi:hypothetical protein
LFSREVFRVTIPIRLILYMIYIAPSSLPCYPTSSNYKRFLSPISYRNMKSTNHIMSPYSSFICPPPPNTLYLFYSPFFFINIQVDVQMGFSVQAHHRYTSLWSIQPLPLLSLTSLPPNTHFSTDFNTHAYILYPHILCFMIKILIFWFFETGSCYVAQVGVEFMMSP